MLKAEVEINRWCAVSQPGYSAAAKSAMSWSMPTTSDSPEQRSKPAFSNGRNRGSAAAERADHRGTQANGILRSLALKLIDWIRCKLLKSLATNRGKQRAEEPRQ